MGMKSRGSLGVFTSGWLSGPALIRVASLARRSECRGWGGAPAPLLEMTPTLRAAAGIPSLRRADCVEVQGGERNVVGLAAGAAIFRLLSSREGGRLSSSRGGKGRAAKAGSVRHRDLLRQFKDLAHDKLAQDARQKRLKAIESAAVGMIDRFEFKDLSQVCPPTSPSHAAASTGTKTPFPMCRICLTWHVENGSLFQRTARW